MLVVCWWAPGTSLISTIGVGTQTCDDNPGYANSRFGEHLRLRGWGVRRWVRSAMLRWLGKVTWSAGVSVHLKGAGTAMYAGCFSTVNAKGWNSALRSGAAIYRGPPAKAGSE